MATDTIELFAFEADLAATLRCVPMAVRFKLDRCGVKLSLRQWNRFSRDTRQALARAAASSEGELATYREFLCDAIRNEAHEAPVFLETAADEFADHQKEMPRVVADKMHELGVGVPSRQKWRELSPLQRFAVIKLARPRHENANFLPALREFGLA